MDYKAQMVARYRVAQAAWERAVDAEARERRPMTPAEEALGVAATRALHQSTNYPGGCDIPGCRVCAPGRGQSIGLVAARVRTSLLRIGT